MHCYQRCLTLDINKEFDEKDTKPDINKEFDEKDTKPAIATTMTSIKQISTITNSIHICCVMLQLTVVLNMRCYG